MFTVLMCITQDHDLGLVLLAALICASAAVTALRFHRMVPSARGAARLALFGGTAVVVGGGVWATHFVAMQAYSVDLPMVFDMGVTLASLFIAVVGMGFGLWWASEDRLPGRSSWGD